MKRDPQQARASEPRWPTRRARPGPVRGGILLGSARELLREAAEALDDQARGVLS